MQVFPCFVHYPYVEKTTESVCHSSLPLHPSLTFTFPLSIKQNDSNMAATGCETQRGQLHKVYTPHHLSTESCDNHNQCCGKTTRQKWMAGITKHPTTVALIWQTCVRFTHPAKLSPYMSFSHSATPIASVLMCPGYCCRRYVIRHAVRKAHSGEPLLCHKTVITWDCSWCVNNIVFTISRCHEESCTM